MFKCQKTPQRVAPEHVSYQLPHSIGEFESVPQAQLVGGIPTPLKNMKVSWDDEIPNIWENNMFQTTNQIYNILDLKKHLSILVKCLRNLQLFQFHLQDDFLVNHSTILT